MENLQDQLQSKYTQVEEKIKMLEEIGNVNFKTNGKFRYNPSNSYSTVDITCTHNQVEMIHAYAFLTRKSEDYEKAAEEIGLKEYPLFKWRGYTPDEWYHDIKLRLKILNSEGQLQKLKEARAKMQSYLPKDNIIQQLLLELPF